MDRYGDIGGLGLDRGYERTSMGQVCNFFRTQFGGPRNDLNGSLSSCFNPYRLHSTRRRTSDPSRTRSSSHFRLYAKDRSFCRGGRKFWLCPRSPPSIHLPAKECLIADNSRRRNEQPRGEENEIKVYYTDVVLFR